MSFVEKRGATIRLCCAMPPINLTGYDLIRIDTKNLDPNRALIAQTRNSRFH
jgi:hypothetical protein